MGDKHSENQDSVYFSQGIYVLCDGHGSNGKQISSFVAEAVHSNPFFINRFIKSVPVVT